MHKQLKRFGGVWVAAVLGLSGCRGGTKPEPTTDPDAVSRQALLEAFGTCASKGAASFLGKAQALADAVAALEASPSAQTQSTARDQFRAAMTEWQRSEPLQFGPAASRLNLGGQDLRDAIYSWPLISRCAVEEQLVSQGYLQSTFSTTLLHRRGLDALEVLLFEESDQTECPSTSTIVEQGTWAAISTEERNARRRAYASWVAKDVRSRAEALVQAWAPEGGNFTESFKTAGQGSTVYKTSQLALNAVSDALFYLEREVKDSKLASPLGLRDCGAPTCLHTVESRLAKLSKANVAANLETARALLQGCEPAHAGLAFDDLLISKDQGPLAQSLLDKLTAVDQALAAIPEDDLEAAIVAQPALVTALYNQLKVLADQLKTEFVSVLDLELPQSLEGDND
jgi:uncharacterized protein